MRTKALLFGSRILCYLFVSFCSSTLLRFEMTVIGSAKSTTPDAGNPPKPSDTEKSNASDKAASEEERAHLSGSRLALVMSAILLAMFLVALVPSPASYRKATE